MNEKPTTIAVQFDGIPLSIKKIPRWVMWKLVEIGNGETKRWSKLPMQTSHKAASSTDASTWVDFFTAQEAYGRGGFDGVGIVFTGEDDIVGIDLDDVRDPATGALTQFAQNILDNVEGYAEVSPSGTGVKIFTRANMSHAHVDHKIGLEIYPTARFFTVTGHIVGGDLPASIQDLSPYIPERTLVRSGDPLANYNPPVDGYDLARVETEILAELDPNCGYTDWLNVGFALHHQFGGNYEALELWERWSFNDGNVSNYTPNACDSKWGTFKGSGATLRSLIFKVKQKTIKEALARGEVILDPTNPLDCAKQFMSSIFNSEEGIKLVHYAEEFFVYVGTHYEFIEDLTIRSELYKFLERCKKLNKKGDLQPFSPAATMVSAIIDAVKGITHLENRPNTKPPVWFPDFAANKPRAEKLVSVSNGLFYFEQGVLLPHTKGFFTKNSLPFNYDQNATCPQWLKFLDDMWGDDTESIDLLQEFFAYILSGDSKQQKFLNIIGPRRSGKGTINKVLISLLGEHNTVAPQLSELCETFGLQPWISKMLASFTDARLVGRDSVGIVSQLLRIVGNDTITVNRKNKESWNGYLPTRIVIYSNEALQLQENSNALSGRMLVLQMTNSFFGREDINLADKLITELSGIFNWALDGHRRRVSRLGEKFIQPKSGQATLDMIAELNNPLSEFMMDSVVFEKGASVNKDDVFTCYRRWVVRKNLQAGSELSFKRRFIAATQEHGVSTGLDRTNGQTQHVYTNMRLTPKAQAFINSTTDFENQEIF